MATAASITTANAAMTDLHALHAAKDEEIKQLLKQLAVEQGQVGWWTCEQCGLLNEKGFEDCAICLEPRKAGRDSIIWKCDKCMAWTEAPSRQCGMCGKDKPVRKSGVAATPPAPPSGPWTCNGCSSTNEGERLRCKTCFGARSSISSSSKPITVPPVNAKVVETPSIIPPKSLSALLPPPPQIPSIVTAPPPKPQDAPSWQCPACKTSNPITNVECSVCLFDMPVTTNTWKCSACTTSNPQTNTECATCFADREHVGTTTTWTCDACTRTNPMSVTECETCFADRSTTVTTTQPVTVINSMGQWRCNACTTLNTAAALECTMCLADKPVAIFSTNTTPKTTTTWKCSACQSINENHDVECIQCCADRIIDVPTRPSPATPTSRVIMNQTWKCEACMQINNENDVHCKVCFADAPNSSNNTTVVDLADDGKREMLDEKRAKELLSRFDSINNADVTSVRLSTKSLSEPAAVYAATMLKRWTNVRDADISDVIAGRPESEALKVLVLLCDAVSTYRGLKSLDLSHNALGELAIRALAKSLSIMSRAGIESLRFRACGLSAMSMSLLGDALDTPRNLSALSFDSNMHGDGGAIALAKLLTRLGPNSAMKEFCMSSSRVARAGGEAVMKALRDSCPQLVKLDLSDSTFGESTSFVADLTSASFASGLKELILKDCGLAGEPLKHLLKSIASDTFKSLQVLNLSCLDIGDKDAQMLAKALPATLQVLDVSSNNIKAAGANALVDAVGKLGKEFQTIVLGGNHVSQQEWKTLVSKLGEKLEQGEEEE